MAPISASSASDRMLSRFRPPLLTRHCPRPDRVRHQSYGAISAKVGSLTNRARARVKSPSFAPANRWNKASAMTMPNTASPKYPSVRCFVPAGTMFQSEIQQIRDQKSCDLGVWPVVAASWRAQGGGVCKADDQINVRIQVNPAFIIGCDQPLLTVTVKV